MKKILTHLDEKLLEKLRIEGLLTSDQLHFILRNQHQGHQSLTRVLIDSCHLNPLDIQRLKSQITGIPFVDLRSKSLPLSFQSCPLTPFHQHHVFPFFYEGTVLHVAMEDPEDIKVIDTLKKYCETHLKMLLTIYPHHADLQQIQWCLSQVAPQKILDTTENPLHLLEQIFNDANQKEASDIHFQPYENHLEIRFRVDGLLKMICVIHPSQWAQILNRIKILANLDITETRRPQSGYFEKEVYGSRLDIRASTHPTLFGENLVLRLINKSKRVLSLKELGFEPSIIHLFQQLIHMPQGLIIITGPTGSGKTSTLYALLSMMDTKRRNVMTLEAPIEAILAHIRQTEIQKNGILSYADGIRSLLRQDPDVILIGEIRDEETAQMALRMALTGHLVLSTMHTQDTLGVPLRLMDLGIPSNMLSGTLQAVFAQRLVRRCCTRCFSKEED